MALEGSKPYADAPRFRRRCANPAETVDDRVDDTGFSRSRWCNPSGALRIRDRKPRSNHTVK
jgi:hypothetical protein